MATVIQIDTRNADGVYLTPMDKVDGKFVERENAKILIEQGIVFVQGMEDGDHYLVESRTSR